MARTEGQQRNANGDKQRFDVSRAINRGGPCGPGEHSSKLIRSRRPRQAQHSTSLARDSRFTLEAKGERLLIPPAIGTLSLSQVAHCLE